MSHYSIPTAERQHSQTTKQQPMNFINLLKVAFKAIANNKFRSFLSMLGIIIGVAAVIVMMAIGQGSKESIRENLSQMGTNIIMIRPGAAMHGETEEYISIKQWEITSGGVFTAEDVKKSSKVCLVGKTVVDELFPNGQDPVGKLIRFKSIPFR